MRLYFDEMEIVCFKAYRDPAIIPFEKMGLGLWFVKGTNLLNPRLGSNGVGKSTVFDALCWVLYGRSVGGHRTPDMKGWGAKDAPEVVVKITAGPTMSELDQYTIKRKGVSNGLWLDGKVCTQETIDRLIGLSYENFLHTIVLGQGKALFFDLSATQKMDVLSETLNLNKWDDRIARARTEAAALDKRVMQYDSDLNAADRSITKLEDALQDLKAKSRTWESDRSDAEDRKRKEILDLEKQLETYQRQLGDADIDFDAAETELRHSQTALDQAQADGRGHIEARAKANARVASLRNSAQDVKDQIRNLLDADNCPACGQKLDRKAIKKHREELELKVDALEDDAAEAVFDLDKAKAADTRARAAEDAHAADIKKFRTKSNDAVDARTRAQGHVARVKAEIDALKKVRTATEERTNPYEEMLSETRRDLRDAKAELVELEEKRKRIVSEQVRVKYWTEGFKLVRLQLIDEVLAELEGVTQTLMSSVGLDAWRVRYDIDKENKNGSIKAGLNVSIYQPEFEQAVKWELFSGGESQRLRLIGAVALSEVLLRRAGVECDLIVLDEPTRHLSPEGVKDTVDFLTDRSAEHLICYIDHAAIDTNRMAGVLRVIRNGAGAQVSVSR